jgi:hypothetical protein
MSMPSTDYSQQILAYLEVWREILEQSTTAAAGLAPMLPTGIPFVPPMPPGMPGMPPGMPGMPPMPPAGPVVPPAPADYAQQLFRYLQAWRQYLEQMTGAMPGSAQSGSAQSGSAQPPSAHQGGNQYPPTPPGNPPLIDKPPVYGDESAEPSSVVAPVSNSNLSLPPNDEGGTASLYRKRPVDGSGVWPPNNNVLVRPATEGGTMVPSSYGNKIDPGDAIETPTGPVTDSRGGGPAASHVLRPPIYDWGNQWVPALRGADVRRAAVTPDTRAQRIPDTPARRAPSPAQVPVDVPSSHRAAMDRVTLDATPKVEIKSNFREPGQAGSSS